MRNTIINILVQKGFQRNRLEKLPTSYLQQLYMEFS